MNKQLAEFIGTFALVFFGCGAAAIGGLAPAGPTAINLLGIASAFGFAIVAMAYGIGPVSLTTSIPPSASASSSPAA